MIVDEIFGRGGCVLKQVKMNASGTRLLKLFRIRVRRCQVQGAIFTMRPLFRLSYEGAFTKAAIEKYLPCLAYL